MNEKVKRSFNNYQARQVMGTIVQYLSANINVTCHKSHFIFCQLKQLYLSSFDDELLLQNVRIVKFSFSFEGRKISMVIDLKSNRS